MAKIDKDFLGDLQWAVSYISATSYDHWVLQFGNTPGFKKLNLALIRMLDRTSNPEYSFPEDTWGWSIDQLCEYLIENKYPFVEQDIPGIYRDDYERCAELMREDGTVKRRSPFTINDANTKEQQLARKIFLAAKDCFKNQMDYHTITNPDIGYKSRGYWYNQALSSGLDYYTYFMKETLDVWFGPEEYNRYPFPDQQIPDWCKECARAEQWSYTPVSTDDFIFAIHDVPLPQVPHTFNFTIRAAGNPAAGNPGNPNTLKVKFAVVSLNADAEVTGEWAYYTLDPIGSEFQTVSLSFTPGPDSVKIYAGLVFNNGDGDYFLYIRNMKVYTNVGKLELQVYGTEGDAFNVFVGQGLFSFVGFVGV